MKKTLAMLLALLMLSSTALFACGDADAGQSTDTTAAPTVTTAADPNSTDTTVPEETKLVANIPEGTNFGGYTFNIANGFHNATKYTTNAIAPTELTGDVINDAMYKRTVAVEDKLGIDVVDLDISQSKMKTNLQAGAAEFDLMTVDLSGVRGFINSGYMLDFNTLPGIDLSMPWWDQNAQDKLSVDGKLFHTFSDFLITQLDNGRALYFNRELHKDLGLEDIYTLVREGTWTLDKLREMGLQAVSDLDGNQTMDANDRYGMICWNATSFYEIYLTSSDAEIMKQGSDGIPYFYCYDEAFYDVCQRLLDVFNTDSFTILDGDQSINYFMEGRGLFCSWTLYGATRMREMQQDFGIVPFPKYDVEQESYWHVSPNPHALMVPNHVDQERTGIILEALAYYSSNSYAGNSSVTYAYFDNAVKVRATRDAESYEMLDIIKNTISYIIKFDDSPMTTAIYGCFGAGQNQFASMIARTKKVADKYLATAFANMGVTVD
ncbi:MAG: extracellular solute-binding protein [Clostridia bacterium]|nr:extracellular solute-binding protein [Clostridia bacterium]